MGKFMKKISAAFLAAAVCLTALAGCGSKVDGTKTVMTVGDEKVPLGAAAFLARYQQAQIYQLYAMYLGQTSNIFSQEIEEGKTYADDVRQDVIDDLTDMVILRQHMGDYKVELTDEEKQAVREVGKAYEEKNSQEVRDKIGATGEHVSLVAELQLVKSKMMEAMAGDIDENVTEEESGQSSVTYVEIEKEKAAESGDASADTSKASDESTSSDSDVEDKNAVKKANALILIEKITSAEDPAKADMSALAKEVDSSWSASKGTFTTKKTDDTDLPSEVVEAAKDLKDGEVAKKVIESDTDYYVVRMDKVNDEEETEKKKEEILSERKQKNYDDKLAAWKEATKVTVDENVWKAVVLSDKVPFDFATESKADSSTASKVDSSVTESTDASAASKTDSSVTESADASAASKADSSVSENAAPAVGAGTASAAAESAAASVAENAASAAAESASVAVAESTASAAAESTASTTVESEASSVAENAAAPAAESAAVSAAE